MKVEIDVEVKVVGASVEEALARVTEKLMVIKPTEADRERYAKEYHHWDKENDGDVDWHPVAISDCNKRGEETSYMKIRIRNVWNV